LTKEDPTDQATSQNGQKAKIAAEAGAPKSRGIAQRGRGREKKIRQTREFAAVQNQDKLNNKPSQRGIFGWILILQVVLICVEPFTFFF
jgi:hypothetical protein